jgi:hypothetical protein
MSGNLKWSINSYHLPPALAAAKLPKLPYYSKLPIDGILLYLCICLSPVAAGVENDALPTMPVATGNTSSQLLLADPASAFWIDYSRHLGLRGTICTE